MKFNLGVHHNKIISVQRTRKRKECAINYRMKKGGKSALACGRKADQVDEKPSSHPTHDGGQNRVAGASTATERAMTFN